MTMCICIGGVLSLWITFLGLHANLAEEPRPCPVRCTGQYRLAVGTVRGYERGQIAMG